MENMKELTRVTVFRLIELIVPLIILSVVGTWLSVFSFIITHTAILIILIVLNVPYFIVVAGRSRALFYALGNKRIYLAVNAVCVVLLAVIIYLLRAFAGNEVFVWMFSLTKLVYFLPFRIPLEISVGVFILILGLVIWLAPKRIEYMMKRSEPDEYDSFIANEEQE